jgi:hypothetical protein
MALLLAEADAMFPWFCMCSGYTTASQPAVQNGQVVTDSRGVVIYRCDRCGRPAVRDYNFPKRLKAMQDAEKCDGATVTLEGGHGA